MKRIVACSVAGVLLAAGAVWAYSVGPGFFWLSNYELVKQADAIVLAKAVDARSRPERVGESVIFEIVERLKGNYDKKGLSAYGHTHRFRGRSSKGDFSRARRGTYAGMGAALDFRIGQFYLLFLTRHKGKWRIGMPPLSRTQEEIDPDDSPWMQAVRQYITIAQLNDYEKEKAALKELHARAAAQTDPRKYPPGLVADIDHHFSTLSPMKSYADLMVFYRSARTDPQKGRVLYALAQAGHQEALPLIRQHLGNDKLSVSILLDYVRKLKDRESIEPIANDFIVSKYHREDRLRALVDLADETHTKVMLRVLDGCREEDELKIVLSWFSWHPSPDALSRLRKIVAGDYEGKSHLTGYLTAMGDEGIVEWAIAQLENTKGPKPVRPLNVITGSPTRAANEMVRKLIAEGDERTLLYLFYGCITDRNARPNPHRWEHIEAIVRLENKSDSLVRQMQNSLKLRSGDKAQALLKMLGQ